MPKSGRNLKIFGCAQTWTKSKDAQIWMKSKDLDIPKIEYLKIFYHNILELPKASFSDVGSVTKKRTGGTSKVTLCDQTPLTSSGSKHDILASCTLRRTFNFEIC